MTQDLLTRWRAEALEQDSAALLTYIARGLKGDEVTALRALAVTAGIVTLDDATRARAVALARGAFAGSDPEARWDALHLAHLSGLTELTDAVGEELGAGEEWVRARASEACAGLDLKRFRAQLESMRTEDADWTVRRLCADALRLKGKVGPKGDLFGRLRALLRTGVCETESGAKSDPASLGKFGLRLPPAFAGFLCEAQGGGRVRYAHGRLQGMAVTFVSPMQLVSELETTHEIDVSKVHDYVWARYVEGERGYPDLDEDAALEQYAARYDAGLIDKDAWNYGVLLFESAYRDDDRRAEHLVRCRSVFEAYKRLVPEAWDVVDDRLEDARESVEADGLKAAPPAPAIHVATWEGVIPITAELYRSGVQASDPDSGESWEPAASLLVFLNDPQVGRGGATSRAPVTREEQALELLQACSEHMNGGHKRKAGRAFGDALELDASKTVVERAVALLTREDLTPLGAAQLLATIPLAGDKPSMKVVRQALGACPADFAREVIEAAGPFDEPDSQLALVINAAASLRTKSHAPVSEVARRIKQERGSRQSRTVRNPWYGK